jgi:predicted small lipoprotein YifL
MKKSLLHSFIAAAALVAMAGCAQIKKPPAQAKAAPVGVRFDEVGSVTLYPGEPCTPQIMFDFHGSGSTVWLGAPKQETKILTEAAKSNRRVHISGKWRRSGHSNCSYVEVTSAEVTK